MLLLTKWIQTGQVNRQTATSSSSEELCVQCHDPEECDEEPNPVALQHSVHKDLPCSSCHIDQDCAGIHEGIGVDDPESSVYRLNVAQTCSRCHEDVYEAYTYSLHGSAVSLGSLEAATCIDCHGTHDIVDPSQPASPVSEENIATTCSQCHNVNEPKFAAGHGHFNPYDREKGGLLWFIWKVFIVIGLLILVKEAFIVTLELIRRLRPNRAREPNTWDI